MKIKKREWTKDYKDGLKGGILVGGIIVLILMQTNVLKIVTKGKL